jgi:hypothetical protein
VTNAIIDKPFKLIRFMQPTEFTSTSEKSDNIDCPLISKIFPLRQTAF